MKPYASIETIFTRSKDTNRLNFGELRQPEHGLLSEWELTEKIDGTNIRVICQLEGITIKGRTDKAELAGDLESHIAELFLGRSDPPNDLGHHNGEDSQRYAEILDYFTEYRGKELHPEWSVTFYGEGYGPGIQKKGKEYSDRKRFRCFDVCLGESWWTHGWEMRQICSDLNIPQVPWIRETELAWQYYWEEYGTEVIDEILPFSIVAFEDRGVTDVSPEGIVARPPMALLNRHGERIMWKLTNREFE